MPDIRVIGDTVHLDGEPVADIRPEVRATLREKLIHAIDESYARLRPQGSWPKGWPPVAPAEAAEPVKAA